MRVAAFVFCVLVGIPAYAAVYEFNATVNNNSAGKMTFKYYCKGTDDNPSGTGTEKGALYHGEIVTSPGDISQGESGSFSAKSTGSTIQGTVVYEMDTGEQAWVYFHVKKNGYCYKQSDNISIEGDLEDEHATATYDVTDVVSLSSIKTIFDAVASDNAVQFTITNPNGLSLPEGAYDSGDFGRSFTYHQQGIQRAKEGYVVSGSAKSTGYIYFANSNGEIINVIEPAPGDDGYNHCGGIQVTEDNILVVGYENLDNKKESSSEILFYDVSDFGEPIQLGHLTISRDASVSGSSNTAGAVALSKHGDGWLLIVANWDAERLDFYTCDTDDLTSENAGFTLNGSWSKDTDDLGLGSIDDNWGAYQNINMFTQADGTLWFIGMHTQRSQANADWADLYSLDYSVDGDGNFNGTVTKEDNMHFYRSGNGPRFDYGSGYYYAESANRFYVYSSEAILNDDYSNRCNKWE